MSVRGLLRCTNVVLQGSFRSHFRCPSCNIALQKVSTDELQRRDKSPKYVGRPGSVLQILLEWIVDAARWRDERKLQRPELDLVRGEGGSVPRWLALPNTSLRFVREITCRKMELVWISRLCHDFPLNKPSAHPFQERLPEDVDAAALSLGCCSRFLSVGPEIGRGRISHREGSTGSEGIEAFQSIQYDIPGADRYRGVVAPCGGGRELRVIDTST